MSRPLVINAPALRARVSFALDSTELAGSLYLRVMGCVYLACDSESPDEESTLEILFFEQARIEAVDGDDLITRLLLVEVPS